MESQILKRFPIYLTQHRVAHSRAGIDVALLRSILRLYGSIDPEIGFRNALISRYFSPRHPSFQQIQNISNYTMNGMDVSEQACQGGASEHVGRRVLQCPGVLWGHCFVQGQGLSIQIVRSMFPSAFRTGHGRCPPL